MASETKNTPETPPPPAPAPAAAPVPPPEPNPFSSPRNTTPPEGGYKSGYPKVYFSVYDRVPPVVIKTAAEEATLDKTNWTTIPPEPPK